MYHSEAIHGAVKTGEIFDIILYPKSVHPSLRLATTDLQQNNTLLSRCKARGWR